MNRCQGWSTAYIWSAALSPLFLLCTLGIIIWEFPLPLANSWAVVLQCHVLIVLKVDYVSRPYSGASTKLFVESQRKPSEFNGFIFPGQGCSTMIAKPTTKITRFKKLVPHENITCHTVYMYIYISQHNKTVLHCMKGRGIYGRGWCS
jgi:hypothetical protein